MRICSNLKYQILWVCYKSYVLQRGKCNIYVSFTFLLVLKSNQIYTNKLIRVLREKICFFRISCFLQIKTFSFITIKNFVILLRVCLHIEFIIELIIEKSPHLVYNFINLTYSRKHHWTRLNMWIENCWIIEGEILYKCILRSMARMLSK